MKHIPSDVFAWLLAAAVAACLASHNLYGQVGVPPSGGSLRVPARAGTPADVWRDAAMRGLSYNESLALYRLRQSSTVPTPLHPRFQAGAGAGLYKPNSAVASNRTVQRSFVPSYPTSTYTQRAGKPFENARPAPTAFERYWPLMLEGREDPKTGVIIWYMP